MHPETITQTNTETIIVGAGVAGLTTALKLAPVPVTVITARPLGIGGSSIWAQGGMAAAVGGDDHPDLHFEDTINAGAGLVDAAAARILVDAGKQAVDDLLAYGVAFDRKADGTLKVGREAAHNRERIVHATGDQAGAAIMDALTKQAKAASHITILEKVVVEDLLTDDQGTVCGVLAYFVEDNKRKQMQATKTVLATGGLGGLYAVTTNPVRAQGHGLAFAARAGAVIRDPEFVQFHPTALDVGIDPAPLATEAIRGEGAWLINKEGGRFMQALHPDAELAPRDIVARGVEAQINAGNGAFLDTRTTIGNRFSTMFPTVYSSCMDANINPDTDLIPIAPACHYHMGGIKTDLNGRSSLNGLWAIGEVASTGVHGANRLASNSLLEAVVFGTRAALDIKNASLPPAHQTNTPQDRLALPPKPATPEIMQGLRNAMSRGCALLRSKDSLEESRKTIDQIESEANHTETMTSGLKSALLTAEMIIIGALLREESRGGHFRTDYPQTDENPENTQIEFAPTQTINR